MSPVKYREFAPPAHLAEFVECAWISTAEIPGREHTILPDGCSDVVWIQNGGLSLVGIMTTPQFIAVNPATKAAGVRFRTGMASLFMDASQSSLVDLSVEQPARQLRDQLDSARDDAERTQLLFKSLSEPRKPAPAHRALAFLEQHAGAVRLDDLARETGVSERQFRRLCIEYTGLPPKLLARILRFRRAVGLRGRGLQWAQLAIECGYFDQAHLVRDFREFSGRTPSEALQK